MKQMYRMNVNFSIFVPYRYTLKVRDMLVISSREFRQNQKMYFEKADKGEQIIVQRGKDKSYALTPINEDDVYFNAKMVERIKESISQVQDGKVKSISTSEEISDLLGL
jgi:PHD/YefM family antitoxin component YafN of YafNO toxin-antitoxin module